MPQTSNSLLSPTKSMVARATNGNYGQAVIQLQCSLKNLRAARIDELADSNEPAINATAVT